MKRTTFLSLFTLLLFLSGSSAWADELFYTLTAVKGSQSAYAKYSDVTIDGLTWNAPGNQSLDGGIWRIGGKSLNGVNRNISACQGLSSAICRVVVNHKGTSRNTVSIPYMALVVAEDADFSSVVDSVAVKPTIAQSTEGSVEFLPSASQGTEWATELYYRLVINVTNTGTSNGGLDLTSVEFYAPSSGVSVARPVITPDGGTFTGECEVSIDGSGNNVYYTQDGSEPTNASTSYSGPFVLNSSCVVKAIAYDADGNASRVAEAEFTFVPTVTSIAELCAMATQEKVDVYVQTDGWVCTGVKSSNAYFSDGSHGILLYQNGHGFELGDKLTGTVAVKLTTYNDCAEIMGLTRSSDGLTVEGGATLEPLQVVVSDLKKNMQGCVITLPGVTYDGKVFIDEDDNQITPYSTFIKLPTLLEGKTYNATGVAIWYAREGIWEIAPRTDDEFELVTSLLTPESAWSVESETVDILGTPSAFFTTNSDGPVTYESSDSAVAVVDPSGNFTLVGPGIAVITAFVGETQTYLADSKSFTLTVTKDGIAEATFRYSDDDIQGQGTSDVGGPITAVRNDVLTLYANRAYAKLNDTHIKVYGSSKEADKGPSYIRLSVAEGYAITEVRLTATGKTYLKTWCDQYGTEAATEVPDSLSALWQGALGTVVLTNQATSQARIKSIDVTYVRLKEMGRTVTIGQTGVTTIFCSKNAIASADGQFATACAVPALRTEEVVAVDTLTSGIPGGIPVLLFGEPGEYKLYAHPDSTARSLPANLLMGVSEETTVPAGCYVLTEQDGVAVFQEVEEGTQATLAGGQAYLQMAGQEASSLIFLSQQDYETGIRRTSAVRSIEEEVVFSLSGQRLGKARKGVNIVGGRKILY